jgi:Na+(H+)/acetate symporter ActP
MKTRTSQTIAIKNNFAEKRIAKSIMWAIGFMIALYAMFIAMATFSVVKRIALETKTKQMVSEINNLELAYLEQSESLDMIYAATLGFRDVADTTFAATPGVALR